MVVRAVRAVLVLPNKNFRTTTGVFGSTERDSAADLASTGTH